MLKTDGRRIDDNTPLAGLGLGDSKDLLDVILELEMQCGVEFQPERINFDKELTLGGLIGAFGKAGAPDARDRSEREEVGT
jgi:acyl carrier protein